MSLVFFQAKVWRCLNFLICCLGFGFGLGLGLGLYVENGRVGGLPRLL